MCTVRGGGSLSPSPPMPPAPASSPCAHLATAHPNHSAPPRRKGAPRCGPSPSPPARARTGEQPMRPPCRRTALPHRPATAQRRATMRPVTQPACTHPYRRAAHAPTLPGHALTTAPHCKYGGGRGAGAGARLLCPATGAARCAKATYTPHIGRVRVHGHCPAAHAKGPGHTPGPRAPQITWGRSNSVPRGRAAPRASATPPA